MANGKKMDILVKQCEREVGGVNIPIEFRYHIWADKDMADTMRKVEGVESVLSYGNTMSMQTVIPASASVSSFFSRSNVKPWTFSNA